MSDLNVVAVLKAKAGSEAVLRDGLAGIVGPTRDEPGCISYELFQSTGDASTFVTVARWTSQEDLDAHMQTPHVTGAFETIGAALDGAPAIHVLSPVGG